MNVVALIKVKSAKTLQSRKLGSKCGIEADFTSFQSKSVLKLCNIIFKVFC